ncbi:hypothetical protein LWI29_035302 [Acer saccharum]|uniref:Retrotransposon gag domain-containing protein n=1 Tax=Acer saccharum TaxID=4024 RepID=A0AA39S155_ACESA|nr:hypothetical protein LWI29_035302 [Acer saccharum]
MEDYLNGHGLWEIVDGFETQSANTNAKKLKDWKMNNSKIVSWIRSTCKQSIALSIGKATSAKSIWDKVKSTYLQTYFARAYQLEMQIRALKQQSSQNISEFHSQMTVLWDQLTMTEPE